MGSVLVPALRALGLEVVSWTRSLGGSLVKLRDAELVFLAVSDGAVGKLCEQLTLERLLGEGQLVVHLAGALSLLPLAPALEAGARTGSLHPLRAVSRGSKSVALRGAAAGIDGSDAVARRTLTALARALGLVPLRVGHGARALYHAAAVLAAGNQVALFAEAVQVFRAATGASEPEARAALLPLALGSLARLEALPPEEAITGPAVRGDLATIRAHRTALASHDPRLLSLYDELTRTATRLAAGRADESVLAQIEALSRSPAPPPSRPGPGSRSSPPRPPRPTPTRPEASSRSPAPRARPTSPRRRGLATRRRP